MEKVTKQTSLIETPPVVSDEALAAKLPWMVEMLPPASLKAAKRNARAHNKAQEEAVANSVLHFGLIKPVVIDEQYRIVAGHVVWRAAKKLGSKAGAGDPGLASLGDGTSPMRLPTISLRPRALGTSRSCRLSSATENPRSGWLRASDFEVRHTS